MTEKKLKIVIGINSLTESQWPAYNSHLQLFYRLGRNYPNIEFCLYNPSRVSIDRMRNGAAGTTVGGEFDYLWFVDDDVIPPVDALQLLLDCDADISAGDVIIRGWPFDHMVFKYFNKKKDLKAVAKAGKGIEDVAAVGFSMCLIKRTLLEKLPEPYFLTCPNSTEDIYFCLKSRDYIKDCTIKINWKLECGHILWPEIISNKNRDLYKKYMEALNPEAMKNVPKETILRVYNVEAGTTYEDVMKPYVSKT